MVPNIHSDGMKGAKSLKTAELLAKAWIGYLPYIS